MQRCIVLLLEVSLRPFSILQGLIINFSNFRAFRATVRQAIAQSTKLICTAGC